MTIHSSGETPYSNSSQEVHFCFARTFQPNFCGNTITSIVGSVPSEPLAAGLASLPQIRSTNNVNSQVIATKSTQSLNKKNFGEKFQPTPSSSSYSHSLFAAACAACCCSLLSSVCVCRSVGRSTNIQQAQHNTTTKKLEIKIRILLQQQQLQQFVVAAQNGVQIIGKQQNGCRRAGEDNAVKGRNK